MEQAKKDCILLAAAKAFARFGFKKASIEEIAKDAGVGKGTVYLAAETKEDLFYQAVHREVRAWTAEVGKVIDPRLPADQILLLFAQGGFDYLNSRPLVRDLLFGNHHLLLPEWAEQLDDLRRLGRANVIEVLELGIKQGIFRGDLQLDEVAKILQDISIATYLFHNRGADRDAKLQLRLKTVFEMILNGLKPR